MDNAKITAKLAALATSRVKNPGTLDSAAFTRLASAMNKPFAIGGGKCEPGWASACRANHGAPHMTGPALAGLLGIDFEATRPKAQEFKI